MLKTYTKDDIRSKKEEKDKKHIDSYNPATSSRELNPYWKDGGSGLPQTVESFRKSRQFIKPSDDDNDYYSKSKHSEGSRNNGQSRSFLKYEGETNTDSLHENKVSKNRDSDYYKLKSYGWKKDTESQKHIHVLQDDKINEKHKAQVITINKSIEKESGNAYLSDEKMNKLAAKLVKAEIMGDSRVANELKLKLEAAREYRKQNPNDDKDDERVMLITTNSAGNSKPLDNPAQGDSRSKGGKRKADTHVSGQRTKYFGNDDKYDLAQMVSL